MVKTYFVGKSVAVHLCNKKLIRKVPILLHTGQNECSVLTTAVRGDNFGSKVKEGRFPRIFMIQNQSSKLHIWMDVQISISILDELEF